MDRFDEKREFIIIASVTTVAPMLRRLMLSLQSDFESWNARLRRDERGGDSITAAWTAVREVIVLTLKLRFASGALYTESR